MFRMPKNMTLTEIDDENRRRVMKILTKYPWSTPSDYTDPIPCWHWEGEFWKGKEGKVEPRVYVLDDQGISHPEKATRTVYRLFRGRHSLPPGKSIWLVRVDPCETDFCVSPYHFRVMTNLQEKSGDADQYRIIKKWEAARRDYYARILREGRPWVGRPGRPRALSEEDFRQKHGMKKG